MLSDDFVGCVNGIVHLDDLPNGESASTKDELGRLQGLAFDKRDDATLRLQSLSRILRVRVVQRRLVDGSIFTAIDQYYERCLYESTDIFETMFRHDDRVVRIGHE